MIEGRALLLLAMAGILILRGISYAEGRETMQWKEVAKGIEYSNKEKIYPSTGRGKIHLLRFDIRAWRVKVVDARDFGSSRLTVQEMADRTKSPFLINGGFFDENEAPLGLIISDSKVKNRLRRVDWGVFLVQNGTPFIIHTRDYEKWERMGGITEALQVGPRLLVNSEPLKFKPQSSERSAIGIMDKKIVFLVTEGAPLWTDELALIMKEAGSSHALNLDGGPSAQLFLQVEDFSLNIKGGWPVPNGISMIRRD